MKARKTFYIGDEPHASTSEGETSITNRDNLISRGSYTLDPQNINHCPSDQSFVDLLGANSVSDLELLSRHDSSINAPSGVLAVTTRGGSDLEPAGLPNGMVGDGNEAGEREPQEGSGEEQECESGVKVVHLKREVGLIGGIALIVSNMIGSGIFISPKGVLQGSGTVGLSLIVWALCGIVSMCGALGMVELGTFLRKPGGDYAYIHAAYGSLPAFLYIWMSVFVLKPSSAAIMSLTCGEYIMALFFDDGCGRAPEVSRKMVACLVILTICAINMASVKLANKVSVVFMLSKILALAIISVAGFVTLAQGHTKYLANGFEGPSVTVSGLAIGFYSGMWAYDGWNNLNFAIEEIIDPIKNVPRAILIAISSVTALTVLVNISYFSVLSPADILASPAVAVSWAEKVLPGAVWLFPIFVGLSTFGSTHASVFSGVRVIYAAAQEGHMVRCLSYLHVHFYTPLVSTMFAALLALLMIIPSDISSLTNIFSFAAWIFYGMVAAGIIIMRFTHPDIPRPYKVPLVFPVITVLASGFLVVSPLVQEPKLEFLFVVAFVVVGIIIYLPFVHFRKALPYMDAFTIAVQKLLHVAPSTIKDS